MKNQCWNSNLIRDMPFAYVNVLSQEAYIC